MRFDFFASLLTNMSPKYVILLRRVFLSYSNWVISDPRDLRCDSDLDHENLLSLRYDFESFYFYDILFKFCLLEWQSWKATVLLKIIDDSGIKSWYKIPIDIVLETFEQHKLTIFQWFEDQFGQNGLWTHYMEFINM